MNNLKVNQKVQSLGDWGVPKNTTPVTLTLLPSGDLGENPKHPKHPNFNYENLRQNALKKYLSKQLFRVAIGKSTWVQYETFNPNYNLREILDDEIVIEFDSDDIQIVVPAINFTGVNLYNAGYEFEWWCHGGKSPHLHIHDLPIKHLDKEQRHKFKKMFVLRYVPKEYHKWVDTSLCGIHLVALEWSEHWKGCYGVKRLISTFDGSNKRSWGVIQ